MRAAGIHRRITLNQHISEQIKKPELTSNDDGGIKGNVAKSLNALYLHVSRSLYRDSHLRMGVRQKV